MRVVFLKNMNIFQKHIIFFFPKKHCFRQHIIGKVFISRLLHLIRMRTSYRDTIDKNKDIDGRFPYHSRNRCASDVFHCDSIATKYPTYNRCNRPKLIRPGGII